MKPEQLTSALQVLTMKQPEWHYCAATGLTTKRAQVRSREYTVQHSYVHISLGWTCFVVVMKQIFIAEKQLQIFIKTYISKMLHLSNKTMKEHVVPKSLYLITVSKIQKQLLLYAFIHSCYLLTSLPVIGFIIVTNATWCITSILAIFRQWNCICGLFLPMKAVLPSPQFPGLLGS